MQTVKIIECPRDAMQGMDQFIPTADKIRLINSMLKVGFDTIDFGSFVSPKAIPQLADTAEVLAGLDLSETDTKLLAIIANERGATDACTHPEINYLGYPFSISETFQQRNTNASIAESLDRVKAIQDLCVKHDKELVIYISMGFGNPYGDKWNADIVFDWVSRLKQLGINIFSIADTVGIATPEDISSIMTELLSHPETVTDTEFGVHLHCTPDNWQSKVAAAYEAGTRRFDSAIGGFGGCPFAEDDLVGNLMTENLISYLREQDVAGMDDAAMQQASLLAAEVYN